MTSKTKTIIAIIVAVAGLGGGGTFLAIDMSSNTNIQGDTIIEGDNFISNLVDPEEIAEAGLPVPPSMPD